MKRKRHSAEQIVKHLRDADQMLGEGKTVAQVCKKLGVTEVTYYRGHVIDRVPLPKNQPLPL